jgi:hypothetical protein
MRTVLALVLATSLGACGSGGTGGGDSVDGGVDAPPGAPDVPMMEDPPDLRIESPDIDIQPGQEITYCWYFRTQNKKPLAITRWSSTMSPGSHHLIMFTTKDDVKQPGTVSTIDCGAGAGLASFPIWTYAAQDPQAELRLPDDDGEGKPLAIDIAGNQAGFIQMHYNNRTDQVIKAHVVVNAWALKENTEYTKTAAFVTFNGNISIPPNPEPKPLHLEAQTCGVPTTSKFWMMTTHAHKQARYTRVRNGMPMVGDKVFESADWEHPGAKRWDAAPFFTFDSGKLTYECEYRNTTNRTIQDGDSAQTDEMCMASGYFFPATRPVFCYNNVTF